MRVLSVLAVLAAGFGALVAVVTYEIMCFDESWGSTMCPQGAPTTTMTAQLLVGIAGLLPPIGMAVFAFRGQTRLAITSLAIGLMMWMGWAFLNDAAVHAWGSEMRLVP